MTERRTFTPEQLRLACELQAQGVGTNRIAKMFRAGRGSLERELRAIGHEIVKAPRGGAHGGCIDPVTNYEIGQVPPGHPLYELDQQMARARTQRPPVDHGWRQSSLEG